MRLDCVPEAPQARVAVRPSSSTRTECHTLKYVDGLEGTTTENPMGSGQELTMTLPKLWMVSMEKLLASHMAYHVSICGAMPLEMQRVLPVSLAVLATKIRLVIHPLTLVSTGTVNPGTSLATGICCISLTPSGMGRVVEGKRLLVVLILGYPGSTGN